MTPTPKPIVSSTVVPDDLPDALYATASDDGLAVALALEGGGVALFRAGTNEMERVEGRLVPATAPLVVREDGDLLRFRDLVGGDEHVVPRDEDDRAWWRVAGGTLVRVISARTMASATVEAFAPGAATPRWQIALDGGVADLAIAGERVIAQTTDARGHAALVAIELASGHEAWRVDTAATHADQGALVIGDRAILSVLADRGRGGVAEKVEHHDLATGALVRAVPLDGPSILARLGARGRETDLGVVGHELWFRFHRRAGGDRAKATACTFDVFDLENGKARSVAGFDECVLVAPIAGGLVVVKRDGGTVEISRLARLP